MIHFAAAGKTGPDYVMGWIIWIEGRISSQGGSRTN